MKHTTPPNDPNSLLLMPNTSGNNSNKSFDWRSLAKAPNFSAAKVSTFKHAPMAEYWDLLITPGIKLEVINTDVDMKKMHHHVASQISEANSNATSSSATKTTSTTTTTTTTTNNNNSDSNNAANTTTTTTTTTSATTTSATISQNTTTNSPNTNTALTPKLDPETKPLLQNGPSSNNKPPTNSTNAVNVYWIASVIKVYGYMALLRYEGYEEDSSHDFWVYLFSEDIHGVGWCAWQGKALVPPKTIESKVPDWTMYLIRRLTGSRTLPENFYTLVTDSLVPRFRVGLKLEVVDKNRISSVRVATVEKSVGGRLLVSYDGADALDRGFWCHERSPLVHPIGWAQFVGHELVATFEYAAKSIEKVVNRSFEPNDATWDMFELPFPGHQLPVNGEFREGMKLEAIDPLNLSTICVASVIKVLRANYLMIGIDGIMCPTGSDWFCYHASSPYIFPAGFCKRNNLQLTPPQSHPMFDWDEYLKETNSEAAPNSLFFRKPINHGFEEGMHIEAVDLMQSRLVCVATVIKVVDRLLRIHFNGWDESFDQWCDCESPDLFPVGWCKLVGYHLESPRQKDLVQSQNSSRETPNRRRRSNQRSRTKKRKVTRTTSSRLS